MNVKSLRAFCLVVSRGSLAAAAEELHLSQPAVSRLISSLENQLRLTLFHRNRRTLRPTAEARSFYREAARILDGIERLPEIATEIREGHSSRLRAVVMSRLALAVAAPAAVRFSETMPDVSLTLEMHHRRDIERWLTGRQFDVGFGPLPVEDASIDIEPLSTLPAIAVFPKAHSMARLPRVTAEELAQQPLVALTSDTLLQTQIDAVFSLAGVMPRIALRTSSSQLACALVARGLGYTISDPLVPLSLPNCLATVTITPVFPLEFGTLWPRDASRSPAALCFRDCMSRTIQMLEQASAPDACRK